MVIGVGDVMRVLGGRGGFVPRHHMACYKLLILWRKARIDCVSGWSHNLASRFVNKTTLRPSRWEMTAGWKAPPSL